MLNNESMKTKLEWYAKFLLIFLVIFIPSRNVLELCLGTYIKIVPDVLILFLFFAFCIYKKGKIQLKSYDLIFALFFIVAFINTIVFQKIGLYIYIFEVRSVIVYYILFFVIRNLEFNKKYILLLTKIFRYITYVLFVMGVIEKISNKTLLFPESVADSIIYADNFARVYSLFFNPNTYGAFLVLSFFIVLYYEKEPKKIFIYEIVVFTSLLLSMSRSSILIFAIGLVVYGVCVKGKGLLNKRLFIHALIVVLASGILYGICEKTTEWIWTRGENNPGHTTNVYDRFEDLKGEEIVSKSNTDGRIYYIKTGLKIFREYPVLGTGFGTYGSAASMNWEPPLYEKYELKYGFYSDNEYIKDLVETGILGLILLGMFCVTLMYDYRHKTFAMFLCIIVLWFGLFYNVLEVQIVAFLLWGVLGIQAKDKDVITSLAERKCK